MSDEQAILTVSFKGGTGFDAPLLVVRAENPVDMLARLDAVLGTGVAAKSAQVAREFQGVYAADQGLSPTATVVVPVSAPTQPPISQAPPATNAGWGNTQPQPGYQAPPAAGGFQPVQPQPAAAGAPFTKQDRFGNVFAYNDPTAPVCLRGPMVKATRQKKAGGTYDKWVDPAHKACPVWREQGNPPVDPAQLAEEQWVN